MSPLEVEVPPAAGPLVGDVTPPGDKSISHRALLLGAIADGETTVRGLLASADVESTRACLVALGARIADDGDLVRVIGGPLREPAGPLDCGNSGTTMRLLAGLLAGWPLRATLVGDASLSRRPMRRVAAPLRALGATVELAPGDVAPLVVRGGELRGIEWTSPIASAQVKSCVLLAGLRARGRTSVREPARSRDHTERMLRAMGVRVDEADGALSLEGGQRPRGREVLVPGDPSSAAFLLAASLLVPGSRVRVTGVGLNPTRTGFLDALAALGATVRVTPSLPSPAEPGEGKRGAALDPTGGTTSEPIGEVRTVAAEPLTGCALGGELVVRAIDEVPILAVLAAFARGRTTITDAAELRAKESDRLAVLARGLTALGVHVEERPDGLVIDGDPDRALRGGQRLETAGDHRLAMALGVAALRADRPVLLDDGACVGVSYRAFWADLARLRSGP